jgi:uncharacterized protein (DUF1499 family)
MKRVRMRTADVTISIACMVLLMVNPTTEANPAGAARAHFEPCSSAPHCVSSQAPETDTRHYIVPFTFDGAPRGAMAALKRVVGAIPRTRLVTESADYLHYEFTSRVFKFVDDVEFYVDEAAKRVDVRSSSRIGWWDVGVNRRRVEQIRAAFLAESGKKKR